MEISNSVRAELNRLVATHPELSDLVDVSCHDAIFNVITERNEKGLPIAEKPSKLEKDRPYFQKNVNLQFKDVQKENTEIPSRLTMSERETVSQRDCLRWLQKRSERKSFVSPRGIRDYNIKDDEVHRKSLKP